MWLTRPGLAGPSAASHFSSSAIGMRLREDGRGSAAEFSGVARAGDRKAANGQAVDLVFAGRQLVLPRDVVARAGRQHLDLPVPGEPLGDVPGVQFGAAADVRAVALNNNRQLH